MRSFRFCFLVASVVALAEPSLARAQSAAPWTAWLGCWAPDSASVLGGTAASSVTCIVPVAGSRAVDALTIVRGEVASRDRLSGARTHAIQGQGCRGIETVTWSTTRRRAFLRSDYACDGMRGTSSSIYAFTPRGQWLRVTEVQSGGGAIVTAERLHEVAPPSVVAASALRAIDAQQLAIATARAAASAKISVPEVMDALSAVDSGAVRSWILASDQTFAINSAEASALTHGSVPPTVLQAMLGVRDDGSRAGGSHDVDAYLSSPTYLPQTALYVCPPSGCYAPAPPTTTNVYVPAPAYPMYPGYPYSVYPFGFPVIVHRGGERHEDFHHGGERPPANPPPSRPRGPSGIRP